MIYGLRNFIGNAIKFSKSKVNIFLISDDKEIKIIVNDDGPGFPKDIIDKLGEPYIKSRSSELNLNSGLGLGTFLGKTLLERQNAKLLFKDDKNLGGASVVLAGLLKIFYYKGKIILVLVVSNNELLQNPKLNQNNLLE